MQDVQKPDPQGHPAAHGQICFGMVTVHLTGMRWQLLDLEVGSWAL